MALLTRWLRRHPVVGDSVVAVLLLISASPVWVARRPVLSWLLAMSMTLPLAVRRRYPLTVFAVVCFAAFAQWGANISLRFHDLTILIALYTVAAYGRRRTDALFAAVVTLLGVLLAVLRWNSEGVARGLVVPLALTVVALALGDDRRSRRAYFDGLEERAERLERERDALAQVAAATERARIARELHDIVTHNLSVMVAQADGALYTIDTDRSRARRAIETVGDTGRHALGEMRRLLGVLRPGSDGQNELAPQPGVDEIPALVQRVRDTGLPVELVVEGRPAPMSAGMGLAAYRVVQEALTNAMKHSGPGATARVVVRYGDDALELRVDDDGAGIRVPSADSSGQGLAGMRERVAMYGGTLQAGPRAGGGFSVTIALPLSLASA